MWSECVRGRDQGAVAGRTRGWNLGREVGSDMLRLDLVVKVGPMGVC